MARLQPIPAPTNRASVRAQSPALTATADIQVTYSGFSQAAKDAFEAAVNVWESLIVSSEVIHVDASWTPLGSGILGSAGPESFYLLGDNRAYPVALAEAVCECNLNGSGAEIGTSFNSAFSDWYLGTDGNAPSDKYDFYTVVLHELGHGLGFLSSFRVSGSLGSWGLSDGTNNYALRYDENEWSAAVGGNKLTDTAIYPNPSAGLKTELTDGGVYFGGSNVVAVLGGRAKLYAPSSWSGGSSNSHFDESTFPTGTRHALMTPQLANGEVIHDPGPLTLALLRDIGWATTDGSIDPTPPVVQPPVGTIASPQQLDATATLHLSWLAATDADGIASYELQRRKGSHAWAPVALSSPTSTSADVELLPGSAYSFRLRASDTLGNVSAWVSSASATLSLAQESSASVLYGGTWRSGSVSGASGGKVRYAGAAGRHARLTFNGTSAAFVTTRAPGRGIAEIWLDGSFVQSVDLYAAVAQKQAVVWSTGSPLTAGAHTIEVRTTGTRNPLASKNRIDIDAFLVWP